MAFTDPYRQHNYMGEHTTDTACESFVTTSAGWTVSNGMWYYNSSTHGVRLRSNGAWVDWVLPNQDFVSSVLDKDLTAPPGSPSAGDRYIVASPATGAWLGQEDDIAQYNGTGWDFTTPTQGTTTFVEDEGVFYFYNGSSWGSLGAVIAHNNTTSIQGGSASERYHMTLAEHTALTGGGDAGGAYHTHASLYPAIADTPKIFSYAGNPNGNVTADKSMDVCHDTTNDFIYRAVGGAVNNAWVIV